MIYLRRKYQQGSIIGSDKVTNPMAASKVPKGISAGSGIASGITMLAPLIDQGLEAHGNVTNYGYGIQADSQSKAIGRGAAQGFSMGASAGAAFGPWGVVIGGAAGAIGGGVYGGVANAKKRADASNKADGMRLSMGNQNKAIANQNANLTLDAANRIREQTPSNFRMLSVKKGGSLHPTFQSGGKPSMYIDSNGTQFSKAPDYVNRYGHISYPQEPENKIVGTNPQQNIVIREGELQDRFNKLYPARKQILSQHMVVRTPTQIQSVNNKFNFPKFEMGGTTPHAVIPKGTLHSEHNNIGSKGLPVIAKDGTKIAEVEREEIIFTKAQTDQIEKIYKTYLSTSDKSLLGNLGKLVSSFVLTSKDMSDVSQN